MKMNNRSYAMIGTGGLGGFYGARLQRAGLETHFLLHSDYEHVARHGLRVESPEGDFELKEVNAYSGTAQMPACDVVAVCLKTTLNHLLPDLLAPILKPDSTILVMQNGLGIENQLAKWFPAATIIGALCFICSIKAGPGHIRHQDYSRIALAEFDAGDLPRGVTPSMREVGSDFEQAGIPIILLDDLLLARWMKLVWNIPYNGLCVALDRNTRQIMDDPAYRDRAEALMKEVLRGAKACGRAVPDSFAEEMLNDTDRMVAYEPSMKIDFNNGRPMEIDAIFGSPLEAAEARGCSLPLIRELYGELKALNER